MARKKKYIITTCDIELALARRLDCGTNVIVPNVFWGLGFRHELDLLVIRKSGWADEIEIKTSASDIKADLKKGHNHFSNRIRRLWFAVPESLADHPDIPERAGIYSIRRESNGMLCCDTIRNPEINKNARRMNEEERNKAMHLGCMRLWGLKEKIRSRQQWLLEEIW